MSEILSWEFKVELTNAHDKVAGSTAHAHQSGNFSLPLIKSQKDPSGQRPGCCQVPEVKRGVSFLPTVRFPQRAGHGYAKAPRPDLILLDLMLPRKDGREVLAEIKADGKLATVPVVVLTASDAQQDVLRAQQLQANSYITKPAEFAQFLDVVRNIESFHRFVGTLPPVPLPGETILAAQWQSTQRLKPTMSVPLRPSGWHHPVAAQVVVGIRVKPNQTTILFTWASPRLP